MLVDLLQYFQVLWAFVDIQYTIGRLNCPQRMDHHISDTEHYHIANTSDPMLNEKIGFF